MALSYFSSYGQPRVSPSSCSWWQWTPSAFSDVQLPPPGYSYDLCNWYFPHLPSPSSASNRTHTSAWGRNFNTQYKWMDREDSTTKIMGTFYDITSHYRQQWSAWWFPQYCCASRPIPTTQSAENFFFYFPTIKQCKCLNSRLLTGNPTKIPPRVWPLTFCWLFILSFNER